MPFKSRRGPPSPGLFLAAVLLFFCLPSRPWAQTELPLWRLALGGIVTGPPQAQAGSVAVILDSGNLKAISTQGRLLWSYYSQGRLSPFLTRSPEGHSYIARGGGTLIAVNRLGRELWRGELGAPLSGAPVCGWDGRLFVPTGKSVSCFSAAGRRLWHWPLSSPMVIPPVLDQDGGIVTVLENALLLRLGPFGEPQTLSLSAVPKAIVPLGSPGNGGRVLIFYHNGGLELADFRSAAFNRGPQPLPRLEAQGGEFLGAGQWRLTDVARTVLDDLGDLKSLRPEHAGNTRSRVEREDEIRWNSALSPEIIAVLMVAPERMSIIGLWNYRRHLSSNHQNASRYEIALWKKLFYPAAALVMMALALPFASLHSRMGGVSLQIFAGVMAGVLFHMLNALFSNLGIMRNWPPFASALAPSALFLLAAVSMIWRVERR